MKYKLFNEYDENTSIITSILTNRGIQEKDIHHYLNTTDDDVASPLCFGKDVLYKGVKTLFKSIYENTPCAMIVDADCDGMTSAALLSNYLYDLFPSWTYNNLTHLFHEGKKHGLSDMMEILLNSDYDVIICPDSSSNNYIEHEKLAAQGKYVLVLDHHEAPKVSEYAVTINNQLSNYPNKSLSGVGVTYQFCRYIDSLMQTDHAENYLDLVALGLDADMMSMLSIETKHLILKGFLDENVKNPFICGMAERNSYSLGGRITPIGAAFYIAPFVNAMVRSGTIEENQLLFNSMLKYRAFDYILSTKKGHRLGEVEQLVTQAVRVATNVKKRQTTAQDAGMELIEHLIEENNMMQHKVLLFLMKPGQIDKNIAGLCANKIMAKYQRPCCILTLHKQFIYENNTVIGEELTYSGSARGCEICGAGNFKDICESFPYINYATGHQGAFGLSIPAQCIDDFIRYTDYMLQNISDEPIYYVDRIYNGMDVNKEEILTIAELDDMWGQDMPEPYVAIENLVVTPEMVTVYRKTSNTLKITLPNKLTIMKFDASDEECELLESSGYRKLNIVGRCARNEFNGYVSPQILIEEYDIISQGNFLF